MSTDGIEIPSTRWHDIPSARPGMNELPGDPGSPARGRVDFIRNDHVLEADRTSWEDSPVEYAALVTDWWHGAAGRLRKMSLEPMARWTGHSEPC